MGVLRVSGGAPISDWSSFRPFGRVNTGYSERVGRVIESGIWDGLNDDRVVRAFEEQWAAFNRSRYCVAVTNGTHALQLALEAADIGASDEVIVPAITWYTTAGAVCDVNAIPVIVDLDPDTACISPEAVERQISARTRALIVVHLYQQLADMDALRAIASRRDLVLIEDCAHAHGARLQGVGPGAIGDYGCYSFQMGKLISAGEGGAILTSSENAYRRLRSLRNCGRDVDGVRMHGGNYRMTSLQAELLRQQVEGFEAVASRLDVAVHALDAAVRAAPGVRTLRMTPGVQRRCGFRYGFLFDPDTFGGISAASFRAALSAELGIQFGAGDTPLNRTPNYQPHLKRRYGLSPRHVDALNPRRWELPVAEALFERHLVVADWRILGCPTERAAELSAAIEKIYENRDELYGRSG